MARAFPPLFVDALAGRIRDVASARRITIVAIDGWGCGGKSTLALQLRRRLGPGVAWIGTDDFFAGFDSAAWDESRPVRHLRWREMADFLATLARDGEATRRRWGFRKGGLKRAQRITAGLVLFDGLYSLKRELTELSDFKIWVEGKMATRMERVARRDGPRAPALWRTGFTASERAYIEAERPWERADIVIAGADLPVCELGRQLRSHGGPGA